MSASSSISRILVNNSTRLSLNDRFTAIAERPVVRRRSRSRSLPRESPAVVKHATSAANHRFLLQLERKHKMQAALKLKRRSMRANGATGGILKRGTIKALRVGANGRPIRTNSLTNIATMKADLIESAGRSRSRSGNRQPLRRFGSVSRIAERLGSRRPVVGGAAERVAKRQFRRSRGGGAVSLPLRRRSRSRARTVENLNEPNRRGRSRSRGRINQTPNTNTRGRSRSRSRPRTDIARGRAVPVKARLGVRIGAQASAENNGRRRRAGSRAISRGRPDGRGVARGRVEKRARETIRQNTTRYNSNANMRSPRGRSRSRTRKGSISQRKQMQRSDNKNIRPRERSRQRNGRGIQNSKNDKKSGMKNGTQQRRGRSRSRRGGRVNTGKNTKPLVNKDDLDKELDQYMSTTKTDMDYLRN